MPENKELEQTEGMEPVAKLPETVAEQGNDSDKFPREYVEKLRAENAAYRKRAADRDNLAQQLHSAKVAALGMLNDPADLPFDESHLTDNDSLRAAVDALIKAKPHYAIRKPSGDIGLGATSQTEPFSLLGALQHR